MARIELTNVTAGGGGGSTTLGLTTTGTSGASLLSAVPGGYILNIPVYQGALTLTTTGSGAATLVGNTLNIPQYSGGGGGTPAGNAGEVQFNSTPAGSFAASTNLSWDNTATQLNIGAPSSPTGKLNVKGGGSSGATVNLRLTDSGSTELLKVLDNGSTNIGTGFNWDNTNNRLGINTSSPANDLDIIGSLRLGDATVKFSALVSSSAINVGTTTAHQLRFITNNSVRGIIDTSGNMAIGSPSAAGRFLIVGSNTSSGTNALLVRNSTPSDLYKIENDGKISYWATNTAAGNTGPQTINRPSGTVNFGIGASSLVVTNSLCTTSSIVFPTVRTNDATAYIKNVVPAAGSFTINLGAPATAETSVGFFIIN